MGRPRSLRSASLLTRKEYARRINAALDFIDRNIGDDVSLAKLASVACFSPYHFHRIFSSFVGEPPAEYVRRLRLEKAAILLVERPLGPGHDDRPLLRLLDLGPLLPAVQGPVRHDADGLAGRRIRESARTDKRSARTEKTSPRRIRYRWPERTGSPEAEGRHEEETEGQDRGRPALARRLRQAHEGLRGQRRHRRRLPDPFLLGRAPRRHERRT